MLVGLHLAGWVEDRPVGDVDHHHHGAGQLKEHKEHSTGPAGAGLRGHIKLFVPRPAADKGGDLGSGVCGSGGWRGLMRLWNEYFVLHVGPMLPDSGFHVR